MKYKAALIIIGDEILSGRTQDTNLSYIALWLNKRGVQLAETRVIPDEKNAIVIVVNEFRKKYQYVFTTGGIGPTHDDITSSSIAEAFNVDIETNKEALELLKLHYKNKNIDLNESRMKMACIPKGATLIKNPISKAPGFKIDNVYVLAGVPYIMQGMLEGLDKDISGNELMLSKTVKVNLPEGSIAKKLSKIQLSYSDVKIGSYPYIEESGALGVNIVARHTDMTLIDECVQAIVDYVKEIGGSANVS